MHELLEAFQMCIDHILTIYDEDLCHLRICSNTMLLHTLCLAEWAFVLSLCITSIIGFIC